MGDLLTAWRQTKDFLRDRLVTSGRSDVNINAVLRVMNSAFDDDSDSLDAAWAEAEAALPEGGYIVLGGPHEAGDWGASAFLYSQFKTVRWSVNGYAGATAESGPAVLRALAAKLREVGR